MNGISDKIINADVDISLITYELLKIIIIDIDIININKPSLVVAAGFSNKSFIGSATMILKNINKLKNKFKKIIIIDYDGYKNEQVLACKCRDEKEKKNPNNKEKIYQPENKLNDDIAKIFDNMIQNELKLDNVHLLGKCAGGGIMIHLLCINNIYKALYLAVPGNPFGVEKLLELDGERLSKIKFIFSWTKQDTYLYHWGIKSKDEKLRYDDTMRFIEKEKKIKLDYKSILENLPNTHPDNKLYHEINQKLIDEMIKKTSDRKKNK
jgi:hypothetical protein